MNKLEVKRCKGDSGYETDMFLIDGKPLYRYINEWQATGEDMDECVSISPADLLDITWTNEYDSEGDARFMKYVLKQDSAITPILSCPDDFDFSCLVIVAEVIKNEKKVVWKRIGVVDHSAEAIEEEKRSGILYHESYSQEDWNKYGDNIALATVDSYEWAEWISMNWGEELFRRRINYTFPYYQNQNNIRWIAECNFEFDETEYDNVIKECYIHKT